ncbi:unnamed protein product [Citrullus colocynthis]|uniref:Uncharacterized protein n=1 Tax=Citrullus colocynthis TaxID=252529 RepID=A0ABP0XX71_9ROSI
MSILMISDSVFYTGDNRFIRKHPCSCRFSNSMWTKLLHDSTGRQERKWMEVIGEGGFWTFSIPSKTLPSAHTRAQLTKRLEGEAKIVTSVKATEASLEGKLVFGKVLGSVMEVERKKAELEKFAKDKKWEWNLHSIVKWQ